MYCATSVLRALLFVINFLLSVAGIVFIAVGIVDHNDFDHSTYGSLIYIISGIAIILVPAMGMLGSITSNERVLYWTSVLMYIISIISVITVIILIVYDNTDTFEDRATDKYKETFYKNLQGDYKSQNNINDSQEDLKCCGIDSYKDYNTKNLPFFNLPSSCCKNTPKICTSKSASLYKVGCLDKFIDELKNNDKKLIYSQIGTTIITIISGILSTFIAYKRCEDCEN